MKRAISSLLMLVFVLSGVAATGTNEAVVSSGEDRIFDIQMTRYKKKPVPEDATLLKFYEEKFGVKLTQWNLDQSKYVELLNVRIASGEIPDLMYLSGQAGVEQSLYDQGVLLPLDREILDKHAPHMMAMLDKMRPGWEEYSKALDGTLIKLPDFELHPNEQAIIWRGDWLKAVGITKTPRTLEEFEAALYAFAKDDPDGNGKDDTYGASLMVLQSVFGAYGAMPYWSFGYEKNFGNVWHRINGKLEYAGIQPGMKEALRLLNKWYEDGVLDPEFVTGENQGGYWANSHPFLYGRIGFTGHGAIYHWMPPTSNLDPGGANYRELMNIDPEIAKNLVYGEPPIGPNGDRGVSGVSYLNNNKGTAFSSYLADDPEKFIKILEILDWNYANSDNYTKSFYGIEGVHYNISDVTGFDNKKYSVLNATEEGLEGDQYFLHGFYTFPAYFEDSTIGDPLLEWKLAHNIGEEIYTNDLNGSLPSDPIYGAELEKITTQAYFQIITGEKPVDYFDTYVKIWKESGGDIFYKEANAQ